MGGQVDYLRRENGLLRDALARLQQEAEGASALQEQGGAVDFAHLLELAREFGDLYHDPPSCEQGADPCSFTISTPRVENHRTSFEDDNKTELRAELEYHRAKVARLEVALS